MCVASPDTFQSSSTQPVTAGNLCGGTGDEEPLVYRAVNLLGGKLLVRRDGRKLAGVDAARGVSNVDVGAKRQLVSKFITRLPMSQLER